VSRGGKENATYIPCPGSYMYPSEVYAPEVVALARGWGITREIGRCQHCGKLLVVTKYGWLGRHKRLHKRGWDRDR
jgi:hypothetical protein